MDNNWLNRYDLFLGTGKHNVLSLGGKEHFDKRKKCQYYLSNKIKMFSVMVGIGMLPSSISSCILCGIYIQQVNGKIG